MPNTTHENGESQENTENEVAQKATDIDTDSKEQKPDEQETQRQAVREKTAKKLASEILLGDKKLEDLPADQQWLKGDVEQLIAKAAPENEIDSRVKKALEVERQNEELEIVKGYLEEADIDSTTLASIEADKESYMEDGLSELKAIKTALRLNGLKNSEEAIKERRLKGMMFMPSGERRRETVSKDKRTEIEKRLSEDLPKGFSA